MNWILFAVIVLVIIFFVRRMMPAKGVEQIGTDELKNKIRTDKNAEYIDVRTAGEFQGGHVKGMKNIPVHAIGKEKDNLPKDKEMVLICQSGNRSVQAANKLKRAGFEKVTNVRGGMMSWDGPVKTGSK